MNNKVVRKIVKIAIWLILSLLALVVVSTIIVYAKKDKIKQLVVHEINKGLITEVKVENISINFLRTFPYASLSMDNVLAYEPESYTDNPDTLFYFQRLYLRFNVLDILKQDYKINSITSKNGSFNIRVDSEGKENYIFWKASSEKSNNFSFDLEKIRLNNLRFLYDNAYNSQTYRFNFSSVLASGRFSKDNQEILLKTKGVVEKLRMDNLIIVSDNSLDASLRFLHNTKSKSLEINKGELGLEDLRFGVDGGLVYGDSASIALQITSNKTSIDRLIDLLPNDINKLFKDYKSKGSLDFVLGVDGRVGNKFMPSIISQFSISNGSVDNKRLAVSFSNINLKGSFSNGVEDGNAYLSLDEFSFDFSEGGCRGRIRLEDFKELRTHANLDMDIDLEKLRRFLNQKEIEELKGSLNLGIEFSTKLSNINNIKSKGLSNINMNGKGSVSNLEYIDRKMGKASINGLDADFEFNNQSIIIRELSAKVYNSNISMRGELIGVLDYLFKTRDGFNLKASVNIDDLNIDDWVSSDNNKKNEKEYKSIIPRFIDLDLNTNISKLSYKGIEFRDIRGGFSLINSNITLNNIRGKVFGGNVITTTTLNSNKRKIYGRLRVEDIDTKSLFRTIEGLGWDYIKPSNIAGKLSSDIDFELAFDKDYKVLLNSLMANIDYRIAGGELNDIELLNKLSYFVDENELKSIRFDEIESNIHINNSCININEIDFRSNAISFSIFGKHYFDNSIDYSAKLMLSELSSKKRKARLDREREEFGEIYEDDVSRVVLFLRIGGSLDKPVFSYDKKRNIERVKEKISSDKEKVTKAIDKDLRLGIEDMKKDRKEWEKRQRGEFIIDWDDDDEINDNKENIDEDNNDTKFYIEWD